MLADAAGLDHRRRFDAINCARILSQQLRLPVLLVFCFVTLIGHLT